VPVKTHLHSCEGLNFQCDPVTKFAWNCVCYFTIDARCYVLIKNSSHKWDVVILAYDTGFLVMLGFTHSHIPKHRQKCSFWWCGENQKHFNAQLWYHRFWENGNQDFWQNDISGQTATAKDARLQI